MTHDDRWYEGEVKVVFLAEENGTEPPRNTYLVQFLDGSEPSVSDPQLHELRCVVQSSPMLCFVALSALFYLSIYLSAYRPLPIYLSIYISIYLYT